MDIAYLPLHTTYGRPIAARDFGGFALSLGAHRPGERIPAHRHEDEYQWCLMLEGGLEEFAGARSETCGAGSLLVRPPDCVHSDWFSGRRGICLNLFPTRAWLAENGFDEIADTYAHHRTRRLFACGQALATELRQVDANSALAIDALVAEVLSGAVRLGRLAREGHPSWLAAVIDQIEADPLADLTLSALASSAGVSTGHLARAFRARFGCPVGDYVRERRLTHAARLVAAGEQTLADVAAASGFYDQAHFTRAFKARYGLSPAAFRAQR